MSLLLLCRREITLERAAVTTDAAGGVVRQWQLRIGPVPAIILAMRKSQGVHVDRRGILTTHLMITPTDTGALIGDRITDGISWYLVQFATDLGDRGRAWAIFAQQIDPQS